METKVDYSQYSVLVIDDQEFIRRIVTDLLRHLEFKQILEAEDGATGFKKIRFFEPDLVICDIEMEPLDGLQFLKILRTAEDAPNPDVPVIFLTQHAEPDTVMNAQKLGVNSFIVKPPSISTLKSHIDIVLRNSG